VFGPSCVKSVRAGMRPVADVLRKTIRFGNILKNLRFCFLHYQRAPKKWKSKSFAVRVNGDRCFYAAHIIYSILNAGGMSGLKYLKSVSRITT